MDKTLSAIEGIAIKVLCAVLFIIMFLVAADAVGRYGWNRPLIFTVDLVTMYLLPATMLIPAGFVLRHGGHISVDLFVTLMPRRLYWAFLGVSLGGVAVVFWVMADNIGRLALENYHAKMVATGMIAWPLWLEKAVFALAMWMFTARLVHIGLSNLYAAISGNPMAAVPILPDPEMREHVEEAV